MSTLNLMIVDDEPGIRSGISRALKNFSVGYPFMDEDFTFNIIEVESGEKALDIIDNQKIDIVLLDNKLPGIEGIEVLEYIKKNDLDIGVIIITSYASLDLAIKATSHGAYNFIPKPFTPDELRMSVENITKHLFLRRMTKKMKEEGKQVRFQFLSVLSHELKSPINAVEGFLNMMKDKQLGENINDYAEIINRALERIKGMRNLIMDLLDLTRIESGVKKRNLQNNDIIEILQQVIDTVNPLVVQKGVTIIKNVPKNLFFFCDKNEFEIILNNLLSNAIKYNVDNGKVYINIYVEEKSLIIEIKDTGIGMTADEIKLLFRDFVRIRNEKNKYVTGSGLGLSIVKKMVELYKGTISVESTPDIGSTFKVQIPYN